MSANPQPRPLVTGDLDLLISRSLDGDLPGEEERELQSLIAADPAARARYEAMARLVGRLEALPEPDSPFALATRVNSQVEADTKGLTASLHRFGFYFRPATLGIVAAGIVAVVIASTVMSPPKPVETVAAARTQPAPAPVDDGRVNVFFSESAKDQKQKTDAVPAQEAGKKSVASAAPAVSGPVEARRNEAKGAVRQEPVLVAAAEAPRAKEEVAFAPERDAPALAAAPAAPPAGASRAMADESVAAGVSMQKAAEPESARLRAAAPAPAAVGGVRAAARVEIVGKSAGTLSLASPARLEDLAGPFDGSYRLELDGSGRVSDVVRLFGGSGVEPAGLLAKLKALSFSPSHAAGTAGSVDVRVRLP